VHLLWRSSQHLQLFHEQKLQFSGVSSVQFPRLPRSMLSFLKLSDLGSSQSLHLSGARILTKSSSAYSFFKQFS
jgi:hypothetical protein